MVRTIVRVVRGFRSLIAGLAFFIGILYLPADIVGLPEALGLPPGKLSRLLMLIDREALLTAFAAVAVLWIGWIDARPFVRGWLERRRAPTFAILERVYEEAHWIKGLDEIYLHVFYLCVRNTLPDAKTLKRVQARLVGYDAPILCRIRSHDSNEIDLRHGETALFEIGRMASTNIGALSGSIEVDPEQMKAYDHNIRNGYFSFELWSSANKKEFGLGGNKDNPAKWYLQIILSADDVKSQRIDITINVGSDHPAVTFEREATTLRLPVLRQ